MLLFALLAVTAPFAYQQLGAWRDRHRYPPPGQIVNGLHIWCAGNHGPSVVLESGIAGTSLSWKAVQDRVANFARVCSYDRAGLGWSEPTHAPRTLDNLVAELRGLLLQAGGPPPYILVGHSFGSLIVSQYGSLYPEEVSGLVLVDPVPVRDWYPLTPHQSARLARGVQLSRRGAWLARAGIVRIALDLLMSGSRTIPKWLARISAGNGASVASRLTGEVRKLPSELWPMVRAHWCLPKAFNAMAGYLESLPASAAAVRLTGNLPTVVLTAPNVDCEIPPGAMHRVAAGSGHWIQLDQPDLVATAIQDLITGANHV